MATEKTSTPGVWSAPRLRSLGAARASRIGSDPSSAERSGSFGPTKFYGPAS